ncbi:MAG: hypothetical protein JRF33_23040 [Deltaproteobacteria bacterium]|nr:hypothetical protein [Deltaproteobacteria bacterium]
MKTTRALKPGFSLLIVLAGLLLINGCGGDDGNEEGCGSDPSAFCVDSDDQSLAATYNASYDWSSDNPWPPPTMRPTTGLRTRSPSGT